jgi:cyclic pyranopterin phosphate synthase
MLGDARKESLKDIWNGERLRALRREFLSGEVRTCSSRIKQISCHRLFDRFAGETVCSEVMHEPPRRLDIRLNGRCDLQCIMCDVWQQPNKIYDASSFWTEGPAEIFPYLKEIDLLGGEPFIQQDTFRLIEEVSAVNPSCRWAFVTNGQVPFSMRLRQALDTIHIREFQVSIDSLDPGTYRAIRRKGELARTLAFLDQLLALGRDFPVKASMCVLQTNWREVPAFLDFCAERGVIPELQFAYYDAGSGVSLERLGRDDKTAIVRSLLQAVAVSDHYRLAPVIVPLALAAGLEISEDGAEAFAPA